MRNLKQEIDAMQAEIKAHRSLSPEERENLKKYYLIRLTYSSNALAGSTLTLEETKTLLENDLTPGGKPLRDTLLAVGHKKAYALLLSLADKKTIEEADARRFHALFLNSLIRSTQENIVSKRHLWRVPFILLRYQRKSRY